ncbi:MAG: ribonuclease HIII, partial [Erysipelotrichia bacterium]|nr:ribonuclease HIII [Erysipelotrichia bacterium]
MSENVISIKLNEQQQKRLYNSWKSAAALNLSVPVYAKWQLRVENCVITCYTSGKVVFQGSDAKVYASPYMPVTDDTDTSAAGSHDILPQAGSDEVGTGDYFGPVCVCATIVTAADMDLIHRLGVKDSKALTDDDIRIIAPDLMRSLKHSLLILDNRKYNKVHDTDNMNAIKAKMHNFAYVNLSKTVSLPDFKIIDQFAEEPVYYHYLKNEQTVIRGIHFETKAENKYPSVGAGSIIARYAFLKSMDQLDEKYDFKFQKGAGKEVDRCAAEFVLR